MSKHNNVNPDHYKVGSREKPGNQVAKAPQQPQAQNRDKERWDKRQKEEIRGRRTIESRERNQGQGGK